MVTVDERPCRGEGAPLGSWNRRRLLFLAVFTLLFLFSAIAVMANRDGLSSDSSSRLLGQWLGQDGIASLIGVPVDSHGQGGEPSLASKPWDQQQVCGRILQIVEAACSYKSADRDSEVYWACVAGELKYTMWSAYGCS